MLIDPLEELLLKFNLRFKLLFGYSVIDIPDELGRHKLIKYALVRFDEGRLRQSEGPRDLV